MDSRRIRAPMAGLLIVIAAIMNPWVLGAVLVDATELWGVTRQALLALDVFLLALATFILFSRNKPPKHIRTAYGDWALIVSNLLIAFAILNIVALLWLQSNEEKAPNAERFFHQPRDKLRDDPEFLRKLYPGRSDEDIAAITQTPNVIAHPTLEFTERPVASKFYNIGFENMRYTGSVTATNAEAAINGSVWLFSGSTGFGHGVADDESIPHYLDEFDGENTYINFAFQGAMQHNEIDKLLLLLRKGYRPKRVVFLDGLNDTIACLATNFAPEEVTRFPWTAYGYTYNIKAYHQQKSLFGTIGELPIGHVLERWRANMNPSVVHIEKGYSRTDDPEDLYVQNPRAHYVKTDYMYVNKLDHLKAYQEKIRTFYRSNLDVIHRLSKAWGFEVFVFFQPNGMILDTNPWIKDLTDYKKREIYGLLSGMYSAVRADIGSGALPDLIDITDLHAGCSDCYVDLAHYHPSFNEKIARAMLSAVRPAH